ncbi:MAG: hypothetical protein K2J32_13730 [Ruminococcus sp.]|nr:hypothetical protein [Ruminococcus sp.]
MNVWDVVLTVINVGITIASGASAFKSWKYYKKNNALSTHTNINKALLKIEKMKRKLPEAILEQIREDRMKEALI